jgi:hypothetical protein
MRSRRCSKAVSTAELRNLTPETQILTYSPLSAATASDKNTSLAVVQTITITASASTTILKQCRLNAVAILLRRMRLFGFR